MSRTSPPVLARALAPVMARLDRAIALTSVLMPMARSNRAMTERVARAMTQRAAMTVRDGSHP